MVSTPESIVETSVEICYIFSISLGRSFALLYIFFYLSINAIT